MKLERLALVAEILGSIAVVITLIVLIAEVRENSKILMASNRQSVAERTQDLALAVATNPDLLAIQSEMTGNPDVGLQQRYGYMITVLKMVEESYLQYRDGLLDEEYWQTWASFVRANLQTQEGRGIARAFIQGGTLTPRFSAWLDVELNKQEEAGGAQAGK